MPHHWPIISLVMSRFASRFILFFFLLFTIPFVSYIDFFPFMRMAMFAERVSPDTPQEKYLLFINDRRWQAPPNYFNSGSFDYLARNHYYRNESSLFLEKLTSVTEETGTFTLKRIVLDGTGNDTLTIATYEVQR